MKKETYEKMIRFFESSKGRAVLLEGICKILPLICAAVYLVCGAALFYMGDERLFPYLCVPAAGVVFVTVLRKLLNRPRPYEALGFTPFLKYREGKGQSFPSRHTASAFLISSACFYIFVWLGTVMFVIAVLIALSRVISGMHYPSDIISGIFISLLIAVPLFYVL